MSELVKKIRELAKKINHTPTFVFMRYEKEYKKVEKQHSSCYGMLASIRSNQPNYCMTCIGERAYNNIERFYNEKR